MFDANGSRVSSIDFLIDRTWIDRLPFVALMGIATSVDMFENRLPRSALTAFTGKTFAVADPDKILEQIFEQSIAGAHATIRFGPSLSNKVLQRQRDFSQSVKIFMQSLKVRFRGYAVYQVLIVIVCVHVPFSWESTERFPVRRGILPNFD